MCGLKPSGILFEDGMGQPFSIQRACIGPMFQLFPALAHQFTHEAYDRRRCHAHQDVGQTFSRHERSLQLNVSNDRIF